MLAGVDWTLAQVTMDGATLRPDTVSEVVLYFDGKGGAGGSDGCNDFSGTVQLTGRTVAIPVATSTSMACTSNQTMQVVDTVLLQHGSARWTLAGGRLRLTKGGMAVVYQHRESIYPSDRQGSPAAKVLSQGNRGPAAYRFYYRSGNTSISVAVETRPQPGTSWGSGGQYRPAGWRPHLSDRGDTMIESVGRSRFVWGVVTPRATRVVLLQPGRTQVALHVYSLHGTRTFKAFGGFASAPRGSQLLVYDAAGHRLGTPYSPV